MARGFAKGLFQGVILCGAAVAALSLALPQPGKAPGTPVQSGPTAETINLPVGSEFARGEDEQPKAPSALTRPNVPALGEAAAVAPPPDEARPAPATATAGRPETPVQGPAAPVAMAAVNDRVDLPAAPAKETPIPVAPPGRVETPSLDRQPERQATESPPAPAGQVAGQGGWQAKAATDATKAELKEGPKDEGQGTAQGAATPSDTSALANDAESSPQPPAPEAVSAPRMSASAPMLAPVPEAARDSAPPQDAPAAEEPVNTAPASGASEAAPDASIALSVATTIAATSAAGKSSNTPDLSLPPDLTGLRLFDRN